MDDTEKVARQRWLIIVLVQAVCAAGAVFGLVIVGKSTIWVHEVLGGAIVLTGMYLMVILPKALAHRWRSPPEA